MDAGGRVPGERAARGSESWKNRVKIGRGISSFLNNELSVVVLDWFLARERERPFSGDCRLAAWPEGDTLYSKTTL